MKRPEIGEKLDGFVQRFDGEPAEWDDVLSRAGAARRRMPRILVVAAAVLVALLALAAPFGLAGRVVGLFRDEGKPIPLASLTSHDRAALVFMFCQRIDLVTTPGKAPEKRCLDGEPRIEEIANNGTRLYWKVTYPDGRTCLASGPVRGYRQYGGGRAHVGRSSCPARVPTPERPITVEATVGFNRGDARSRLFSAMGLAGEGVATVGLIEPDGDSLKVDVKGRTYEFARPPARAWEAIAAFDEAGKEVYRESLHLGPAPLRRPTKPPKPRARRPVPLPPLPQGSPIQHMEVPGATIDIYKPGFVAVHFKSATSQAYRVLRPRVQDPQVSISCLDLEYGAGRWAMLGGGTSGRFGRDVRGATIGTPRGGSASPPFDACSMPGRYGRRWNDARGMHDPLEFPLTPLGRSYFAQQAAARDLGLFMRTPQMRAIRKAMIERRTVPSGTEIARRFSSRVVGLAGRTDTAPKPNIGVWSNGHELVVVSKRAEDGRRMFVTLRSGVFGPHNLGRLTLLLY